MAYQISGTFIEACDCYVVCPCWVAAEPDEGHCTGLFAWSIDARPSRKRGVPTIDGVRVAGRTVVAVTTHTGGTRREATSYTVLYVDHESSDDQFEALVGAFSGRADGPLRALAAVSGTVLDARRAGIDVDGPPDGPWTVTVRPETGDGPVHVHATGEPSRPDEPAPAPGAEPTAGPLVLQGTALDTEIGIGADGVDGRVRAQQGGRLALRATGLPGAYLDLTGRSGMRGAFSYTHRG